MKVVIPAGTGHVGAVLRRHFAGHEVVLLSRTSAPQGNVKVVPWDGQTLGPWTSEIDGADVVVNLAGRSVDCRYNPKNLDEMMSSRVLSTRAIGQAIQLAKRPPRIWLQAGTATIYAHRFDAPNDEHTGILGGEEPNAPRTWKASIDIARAWEQELENAVTPFTRKVAMRSAMTMSTDKGSVFDVLAKLCRMGLGGNLAGGNQYVSWVHETDFSKAVQFLIDHEDLDGPINVCSPNPLPYRDFIAALRKAVKAPFGLPATRWMVEIGTWLRQTESELVLKSRRVVPARLLEAGFKFEFPTWPEAARDLARREK